MLNLKNIHSLTDFRRNASNYIDKIRGTQAPLVLTVNGEAAVVIQDAQAFQQLLDRLQDAEEELRLMKLDALRRDIAVGIDQLESEDYMEYDENELSDLFDDIKAKGRSRLSENANR